MTIVVTGGSGFIGSALTAALLEKGHTVVVIDQRAPALTHQNLYFIQCNLEADLLPFNVLERTDAIIHLAGKPIFEKWTEKVKQAIKQGRVEATRHIIQSLERTTTRPSIFISASAVGYYGEAGDTELDEKSPKGNTFLSDVVQVWEAEAAKAEQFGCRVVIVRTAPVIGTGGFLAPLVRLARFWLVFKLGRRDFWQPWIHLEDIVRVYLFALETSTLQGVVNAAAPTPVRHSELMKHFAKAVKRRLLGALPLRLVKFLYGDFATEITTSQKVYPRRLLDKGFTFEYTNVEGALRSITHEKK
ncbi:MAG TPA: TIGR01777 family oxidoreductase [Candidatus Paceibacterota bacterium]|nr:TIGR01777 family oxidoreductase [Candidatus Paceibacterota bacterium]